MLHAIYITSDSNMSVIMVSSQDGARGIRLREAEDMLQRWGEDMLKT